MNQQVQNCYIQDKEKMTETKHFLRQEIRVLVVLKLLTSLEEDQEGNLGKLFVTLPVFCSEDIFSS
jgi:hypothetical protein